MAAPELIEQSDAASTPHPTVLRVGFALLTAIGLYLTYFGWITRPNELSKEQKS